MSREEIYEVLYDTALKLACLHGRASNLSGDARLSVGEALGAVMKARSQVGRDIDEERTHAR